MQSSNGSVVKKKKYNRCRNYSITEKLEILQQLERAPLTQVARQYSVKESTILYWRKNRSQLKKVSKNIKLVMIRRQKPLYEPLEKPLYFWFYESRLRKIPISNAIIKTQALELSKGVHLEHDFVPSDYWLSDWKARYQIHQLNSSIDESATIESKEGFARRIQEEGLDLRQIFNADETFLNYRLLPAERKECKVSNSKHNVDRITIMACCNADASFKLPLVVIGKCEQSKIISTVKGVYYVTGASVRMTGRIFKKWFKEEFVPRVTFFLQANNLPLKAMLLLDNTPSHFWTESLSMYNIKAYYLKPNTSPLIQPMKREIIETLKRSYRIKLLASVVCNQKSGVDAAAFMESITVKDAVNWMSDAWNKLSNNTILKSWQAILPEFLKNQVGDAPLEFGITNNDLLSILHSIHNYQNASEDDVRNWIRKDDNDSLDFMPSNVEIIQMAEESNENEDEEVDIAVNEQMHIAENEQMHVAENEQMHIAENEQMHVAENGQMHVAENEKSLCIKEESIDIEPEHAISAAESLCIKQESIDTEPEHAISAAESLCIKEESIDIEPDHAVSAASSLCIKEESIDIEPDHAVSVASSLCIKKESIDIEPEDAISAAESSCIKEESIDIEPEHAISVAESLCIKEEGIDIEPEHAISAANTLISFYERNNLLDTTEIEVLRRAKDIAMQLKANECYFA